VVVKVEKVDMIAMPEGCHWQTRNNVYSVYYTYAVLSSDHQYLGDMTDLLGQTNKLGEVITIATDGRKKIIEKLKHEHKLRSPAEAIGGLVGEDNQSSRA